ncbi:MAG: ATP-binding protein [Clostridiales bacterium]|nr:ATP-binding protein [Clostridiales bacterium]
MNSYQKAISLLRDRRREALDRAHLAFRAAIQKDDGLYAAFCEYQEQAILSAQNKPNDLEAAKKKLTASIKAAGLSEAVFNPPHECELCKDTGMVFGKYCKCIVKRVINSDKANLSISPADFDETEKTAPSPAIKKAYKAAREYLSPENTKPFFVLVGTPGTGKTVLASAIVGAAMENGASAVSVTSFDFVRRALDYHTQFSIADYVDRFTPMLDCDLLVIDDLGRESVLKNVTMEYLYTVINERWRSKKRTVITTNLTPSELNARYGEGIFSRIYDKSRTMFLSVDSKNKRIKSD